MDFSNLKDFGEFKCPYCNELFFEKKKLVGHIGGKHRRNQLGENKCKFCGKPLIKGQNWANWAIKQGNNICILCKRKQNRNSYRKKTRRLN